MQIEKKVIIAEHKYFIQGAELPIYLIYIGSEADALFQLQRGVEKDFGFESHAISPFLSLSEIKDFLKAIEDVEYTIDLIAIKNKVKLRFESSSKMINITLDNRGEIEVIYTYIRHYYLEYCEQWSMVKNMEKMSNPVKDIERLITGDSKTDE